MLTGHGDDIYDYTGTIRYNFSSNVFPATQLPGLKDYLAERLACIDNYPPAEARAQERLLAAQLRIRPDECLITSGATEAIYLLAQATGAGCRSAIIAPTFSEYADAACMYGHQVTYISSIEEVTDGMQLVWLCNPNNPTGTVVPHRTLVEAAFRHTNTIFVIDQSYEFFCEEEPLQPREAVQLGNVVQLHSMTKRHAVPGLRLGFVTGARPWIEEMRQRRMPWSVNALALHACDYLLAYGDAAAFDRTAYLQEARRLQEMLNGIENVEVMPSQTHFMLMHVPMDSLLLKRRLVDEYGILVRSAHNFVGLDNHFIRVAAQEPQANDLLVEALGNILNGKE